ncbi:conjugative transfer protein MobI(A/C) [Shewanella chilikensis]|uniref:conjugative transfer protein MobI(A/C) n=1 Tax=Shewanella chilikensis TaxID=558541 RepID=UPI001F364934|nr:conjugative transfer protein MobI(A/C) [Shewanella chilikensis]MCE9788616.1 hypothetical protein [Shewanella chilikensis]
MSDLFWQHNKAHRGKETPGYPGHYGCRVRLRDRKFEIYWFYNEFTRKKGTDGHFGHRPFFGGTDVRET